jgi:hypothetical protein
MKRHIKGQEVKELEVEPLGDLLICGTYGVAELCMRFGGHGCDALWTTNRSQFERKAS